MRSRLLTLMFIVVLVVSFAACSKKNQNQNAAAPASDNSTAAQPNQSATPSQPSGNESTTSQTQAQQAPPAPPAMQEPQQGQQAAPAPTQEAAKAPEPPPPLVVPAGAHIVIRMGNSITSKTASPGDTFTGSVARPVTVHGVVAIPAGTRVSGKVIDAKSPGRFKGQGILSIVLTSIDVGGTPVAVRTSAYTQVVKGKGKRTAVMAGGGTGAGALIGGLAGGGKGALIGGLVGAGAGTAGAAFTGNKELEIPAESAVTFRLARAITVEQPAASQ